MNKLLILINVMLQLHFIQMAFSVTLVALNGPEVYLVEGGIIRDLQNK